MLTTGNGEREGEVVERRERGGREGDGELVERWERGRRENW